VYKTTRRQSEGREKMATNSNDQQRFLRFGDVFALYSTAQKGCIIGHRFGFWFLKKYFFSIFFSRVLRSTHQSVAQKKYSHMHVHSARNGHTSAIIMQNFCAKFFAKK
jgi:hypothetical protein